MFWECGGHGSIVGVDDPFSNVNDSVIEDLPCRVCSKTPPRKVGWKTDLKSVSPIGKSLTLFSIG